MNNRHPSGAGTLRLHRSGRAGCSRLGGPVFRAGTALFPTRSNQESQRKPFEIFAELPSAQHLISVCLRLIEASTSVTDGRPVFRGGWLESRADKHHKLL